MMAICALLTGGRLVLMQRFSPDAAIDAVERERVTVLNGAPAHFRLVLDRLERSPRDVSSLRLSVGTAAAFPAPLVRAIWDRLGVRFMYMYGSSEGVGVATTDPDDILLGAVGRPAAESVEIVGPDRQALPAGEVGEIAFSRKVFPVRSWGDADGDGGDWFYSGDRGMRDAEGRLYVYGRLKHQIDRGGMKVDPVEVESALLGCRAVADATVLGMPDPVVGEVVCACIVATGEQPQPRLGEIREALGRTLTRYKLPEELRYLQTIPRTQVGKVDLTALRGQIETTPHVVERR
jgi:non-ribosomal peptide synthetase component E (peptide arylation enzyme)